MPRIDDHPERPMLDVERDDTPRRRGWQRPVLRKKSIRAITKKPGTQTDLNHGSS